VKLQEAFAAEKTSLGAFADIGYKTPGDGNSDKTTVFDYSAKKSTAGEWNAVSLVGLNDCQKGKQWALLATYDQNKGTVSFKVGSDDKANCITPLTPNFCNLATNGQCEDGLPSAGGEG
jgi:hypothetical protein